MVPCYHGLQTDSKGKAHVISRGHFCCSRVVNCITKKRMVPLEAPQISGYNLFPGDLIFETKWNTPATYSTQTCYEITLAVVESVIK